MNRRTTALIVLGVVIVVFAGAWLAVRVALDTDSLRGIAERRLSETFGQKVRIGEMRVRLLPVPSVEGRQIETGGGTDEAEEPRAAKLAVALDSVRIVPRLSTVFSSPIVVERVELNGLDLRVTRAPGEEGGALPLPAGVAGAAGEEEASLQVQRVVLRNGRVRFVNQGQATPASARAAMASASETPANSAAIEQIDVVSERRGPVTSIESLRARIGGSTVSGSGQLGPEGTKLSITWESLSPADAGIVLALAGVEAPPGFAMAGEKPLVLDVVVDPEGELTASGRVEAETLSAAGLELSSLGSPLTFENGVVELAPLAYIAYGGKGSGRIRADVMRTPPRWSFDGEAAGVDIGALVSSMTASGGRFDGSGSFNASLRGEARAPVAKSLQGTARFDVANGVIRDFPLLTALDAVVGIDQAAGSDFHFQRLSATFQVANGSAATSDFEALAGEVRVNASGVATLDGALSFKGTATFSREKSQELIRRVHELSGARNSQGEVELPFTVSGTLAEPRFNVDIEKVLGRALEKELQRQLQRRLQGFIKK